ncbi:MAG: nitroreductase family protein, partial [Alistipes sp.]|nr:nitroreductase family protein [Alistipes sp.]
MEFKKVLAKRRSTRKFLPTAPSREVLLDIVHDALTAPSSRNMHTTRFLIVDDRETLDKLASLRDYGASFLSEATAAIVVMGDTTKTDLWRENCAISATMLQLSIVDHGM